MVWDKKKSGDPDFDDKQPADQHAGKIVSAPDGRDVLITESNGPVDRVTGEHVNMETSAEDLDNRPKPGQVAKEPSEVQTYAPEDLGPQREAGKSDDSSEDDKPVVGPQSGDEKAAEAQAGTAAMPPAKSARRASTK